MESEFSPTKTNGFSWRAVWPRVILKSNGLSELEVLDLPFTPNLFSPHTSYLLHTSTCIAL